MLFRFIILSGPAKGERITIGKEPLLMGHDPACTLVLRGEDVAAKHAVVEQKGDHLTIRDLGSMGKILVNGLEVATARIKHGDVVEVGRTRFLVEALVEADVSRAYGNGVGGRVLAMLTYAAAPVILLGLLAVAQHRFLGIRVTPAVAESSKPSRRASAGAQPGPAAAKSAGGVPATQTVAAASMTVPKPAPVVPKPTVSNSAELARVAEERRRVQDDLKGIRGVIEEVATIPAPVVREVPVSPATAPPVKTPASGAAVPGEASARQPPRGPKTFRILSVNQNRFQESDEFDEMRVVDVRVGSDQPVRPDAKAVQVQIVFFDQDSRTGDVVPSRAVVPKTPMTFSGAWQEEGQSVTASYVVPKGFRLKEATAGRLERYYGYVVRVYYEGSLQDEDARPKALLQYSTGTRSGGAAIGSRAGTPGQEVAGVR